MANPRDLIKRKYGRPPLVAPRGGGGGGLPPLSEDGAATDATPPAAAAVRRRRAARDCSPASWEEYFEQRDLVDTPRGRFAVYRVGSTGPVLLCLHGGGHSALSWAAVTPAMARLCRVLAYDARGHGSTVCEDEGDLSAESQVEDCVTLVEQLFPGEDDTLKIVIAGHSMGGAIATRVAASRRLGARLVGLVVVDVVEGTAMAALPAMSVRMGAACASATPLQSIVTSRPQSFRTLEAAIEWAVGDRIVRNAKSARVSIPPQLRSDGEKFVWRTDLLATEPYWQVVGLPRHPALGTDRLDTPLTIGQMQGKYQLEDLPDEVAEKFTRFIQFNRFDV